MNSADQTKKSEPARLGISILAKLTLFVALLVFLSATLMNWIGFRFARQSLTKQIHQRLNTVAHDREQRLNAYAAQQKERVALVASRTRLRRYLVDRLDNPDGVADFHVGTQRILRDANSSTAEFLDIWITDPNGLVVAATDDKYLGQDFSQHADYLQGKETGHLGTPRKVSDGYEAYLSAPAKTNEERFLGVVMVILDVRGLVDLLADTTGLGDTGEVLVASREVDQVNYLVPPLRKPNQSSIDADRAAVMVNAIDGKGPAYGTSQYDGRGVLVAWRPVKYQARDFQPWGMVVKIDASEAYAPIAHLTTLQWLLQAVLVILSVVVAFVLAKRFTQPILKMAETAKEIAEGDLNARVDIGSADEVGQLATAFNQMTDELADSHATLEQRVEDRTHKLAETNQQLAQSNKDLDDFAYIASHDLKEPLRGISNYVQFLGEDYADQLGEDGREKIETVAELCQRMEHLIDTLLEYSRVGRAELAMKQTDLNELVDEVVGLMQVLLDQQKVDVRIPRPLPKVECDHVRVRELFNNLIANAVKYNDKSEKWLELGYEEPNGEASGATVFYVRDNGIGIPEKHIDDIFRIFKRLHGRTKFGGGTGAGLTFVKQIVERHGGRIWVKSTPDEGTTFYFTLG